MKQYNSMYLGICINNNDPEKRGRVQIFVPHIMPTLYKNWNAEGKNIQINCVGDNMISGLTSDIIKTLSEILPWAEAASPVIGTSSPGNLLTRAIEGAKGIIGKIFDQGPEAEPANISDLQGLFREAANWVGTDDRGDSVKDSWGTTRGPGNCLRGTQGILGALTGHPRFNAGKAGGLGSAATLYSTKGGQDFTGTGLYESPIAIDSNYMNDSSQWQVGDTVACSGGGKGYGHIQVWTGKAWVSDFTQNRVLPSSASGSYDNFALHRPNAAGKAAISKRAASLIGGQPETPSQTTTSVSGEVAAASPHSEPTPSSVTDEQGLTYGNIANPEVANNTIQLALSTTPQDINLGVDSNGMVDPNQLNSYMVQQIAKSKLNGYVPADGAKYGIDGSPQSWANYFTKLSEKESSYEATQVTPESFTNSKGEKVQSTGLFQLSYDSVRGYGVGKGMSDSELNASLRDPAFNANAAISIHEKQVLRHGKIEMGNGTGAGGYFASASMSKIKADVSAGKIGSFDATAAPSGPRAPANTTVNLINNTDRHGPIVSQNLNNMAKGLFTFPAAGAMLWVFFRDGNPLYPVYFAASYSQDEWKSAYRLGSDGPGYRPASTSDNPVTSTGGVMNLNGVGGIRWEDTNNPQNRLQDQKSIMFFGEDGSNIFMGKGYNQFFSKFDRRDQVEGDRWETTLGFKEEWIQGDNNQVTMGDVFVKIGNVSQPAVDAVQKIQQILKEVQKPLSETQS